MTRYAVGTAWERKVRAIYEASGFTVIRSAGSKGSTDLIAWDERVVQLIQCKKEMKKNNYHGDAERLRAVPTPKYQNWVKLLWIKSNKDIIVRSLGESQKDDRDQHMTIGDINRRLKKEDGY